MNVFSDEESKALLKKIIPEVKKAASESEEPSKARGPPEGKASRETEENPIYEKETDVYVTRKESEEEFNKISNAEGYTTGKAGMVSFAYRVCRTPSKNGQNTAQELEKLGIKSIIHEGLKINHNGITTIFTAGATVNPEIGVFIDDEMERDAVETAGHEAFHFWRNTSRKKYIDVLQKNIVFSSKDFYKFQSDIATDYSRQDHPRSQKSGKREQRTLQGERTAGGEGE